MDSSFSIWLNSPVNPSDSGLLFVGRFLITDSILLLLVGLFGFSFFLIQAWKILCS